MKLTTMKFLMNSIEENFMSSSNTYAETLIMKMLTLCYDRQVELGSTLWAYAIWVLSRSHFELSISKGFLVHFIMTSASGSRSTVRRRQSSQTWWLAYCVLRRRSNAFLAGLLCFLLTRLRAWLQARRSCTGPARGRTCAWRTSTWSGRCSSTSPRQGGLGRWRRRVQAGEVRERGDQGGQVPQCAAVFLQWAKVVHRSELRNDRGKGRGRHDLAEVCPRAVPQIRPRAHGRDHPAPKARAPHAPQALVGFMVRARCDIGCRLCFLSFCYLYLCILHNVCPILFFFCLVPGILQFHHICKCLARLLLGLNNLNSEFPMHQWSKYLNLNITVGAFNTWCALKKRLII